MKRLSSIEIVDTERGKCKVRSCNTQDYDNNCDSDDYENKCSRCNHASRIMWKCAEYEESGLTPERVAELAAAEREERLVVLPKPEDMEERLCDLCKCSPEYRGVHLGPNGPYGCEGSWCGEAYERFLDDVEDLVGSDFHKKAEPAPEGESSC